MAYIKKGDLIILNSNRGKTTALVSGIEFRKYRRKFKDRETKEVKYVMKSMPYAVCTITTLPTDTEKYTIGSKFIIAGYKLRNHATTQGDKCLVLHSQYLAEFQEDGERWVTEMIEKSKKLKKEKEK